MRVIILIIFMAASVISAQTAHANDAVDPMTSPEATVQIQLRALQNNDVPRRDSGIRKVWAFAHPENKRFTGPLMKFMAMIKGPGYGMLLDHRRHDIQLLEQDNSIAAFVVRVIANDGLVYRCQWQVALVISGENAGAWLTISVSPPILDGKGT